MNEILRTPEFDRWMHDLRDKTARARIDIRITRLAMGLAGDAKTLREGVSELRVDYGPGYRVYFTRRGNALVILLIGGTKGTQAKDIEKAIKLSRNL